MESRRNFLKMLSLPAASPFLHDKILPQSSPHHNGSIIPLKKWRSSKPLDDLELTFNYLDHLIDYCNPRFNNLILLDAPHVNYADAEGILILIALKCAQHINNRVLFYTFNQDYKKYLRWLEYFNCFPDMERMGTHHHERSVPLYEVKTLWQDNGIVFQYSRDKDNLQRIKEVLLKNNIKTLLINGFSTEKDLWNLGKSAPEEKLQIIEKFAKELNISIMILPDYCEQFFYSEFSLFSCMEGSTGKINPEQEKFYHSKKKLSLYQKSNFELLSEPKIWTGDVSLIITCNNSVRDIIELEYFTYVSPEITIKDEYNYTCYPYSFTLFCDISEERSRYRKDYYKRFLKGKMKR